MDAPVQRHCPSIPACGKRAYSTVLQPVSAHRYRRGIRPYVRFLHRAVCRFGTLITKEGTKSWRLNAIARQLAGLPEGVEVGAAGRGSRPYSRILRYRGPPPDFGP